jgi:hypothetical protein
MLGWHISIYRQENGGKEMAPLRYERGDRIAVWQARLDGLAWLDELVEEGRAFRLGQNGYPTSFTVRASDVLPVAAAGPPEARKHWVSGPNDVLTDKWEGRTTFSDELSRRCHPEEWLIVEAWDES